MTDGVAETEKEWLLRNSRLNKLEWHVKLAPRETSPTKKFRFSIKSMQPWILVQNKSNCCFSKTAHFWTE